MAFGSKKNSGNTMTRALGLMVGLGLSLYVFAQIIPTIEANINGATDTFYTAYTLWIAMLPIIGLLGVFSIVWWALKQSDMV